MEPINISETYTGIDLLIAQKCDDGNGLLEEENGEISIFTKAQQEFESSGKKQVTIKGIRYYYDSISNTLRNLAEKLTPQEHVEEPDALRVDKNNVEYSEMTIPYASQEDSAAMIQYKPIQKITANHSTIFPDQPIDNDVFSRALDNIINNYIKNHNLSNSALLGHGQIYLDNAKEKNVDPFTLLGIAMHESAFGTSNAALNKNNIGGLKGKNKQTGRYQVIEYENVSDSINVQARAVARQNQRNTTIGTIGKRGNYVCGSSNDRNNWVNKVSTFANNLVNEYNKLLAEKYDLNTQNA